MDETEFWGETRACPECGSRFFGRSIKMYCTPKCKNKALGRQRRQDPEKRAMDTARKNRWRRGLPPERRQELQRKHKGRMTREEWNLEQKRRAAERRRHREAERGLILDDWQHIGPHEGWSVMRAAPRIGVTPQQLGVILKEAREAGDPRGVIPETVGGVRLYHAA